MEHERYLATVVFDSKEDFDQFVASGVAELGGRIVANQIDIEHVPDVDEISRNDLDEVIEKQNLTANWGTRIWKAAESMQLDEQFPDIRYNQRPKIDFINLAIVKQRMQKIEEGLKPMAHGLGEKGWNIFAGLINDRFADDLSAKKILPWDDEIHRRLSVVYSDQARQLAAQRLAQKYIELQVAEA